MRYFAPISILFVCFIQVWNKRGIITENVAQQDLVTLDVKRKNYVAQFFWFLTLSPMLKLDKKL